MSEAADAERKILAECIDDRELGATDEQLIAQMSPADRQLVIALDRLRSNPEALHAAADLFAALVGHPQSDASAARQAIPSITGADTEVR